MPLEYQQDAAIDDVAEQKQDEVQRPPNPRDEILASLAAEHQKELDSESGVDPIDSEDEIIDKVGSESNNQETPVVDEQKEPEKQAIEPQKQTEELITIRVDGIPMQVPRDRVLDMGIRTLQKETAADKRLEEATRLLREAQAKVQAPQVTGEQLAQIVRHGSDEEAALAMNHLVGRQQATPDEIVQVAAQLAMKHIRIENDAEWFKREYSDIMSDPYLVNLVVAEDKRRRDAGDQRTDRELFTDIGNDLRKWRGGTSNVVATQQEKQDRKQNITNVPSASARKAPPPVEKEQSVDDVIASMRKSRGKA